MAMPIPSFASIAAIVVIIDQETAFFSVYAHGQCPSVHASAIIDSSHFLVRNIGDSIAFFPVFVV